MAFEEQLPEWEAEGTQPPKTKRVEGWQPTEKPPAAWFNWLFNRTYKVLRELQQKAAEKEDVQLALQTAQQAEQTANQAASDLAAHLNEITQKFLNVDLNIIDIAVELEILKDATLNGVTANIFVETFQTLDDINLERGSYNQTQKRLEV